MSSRILETDSPCPVDVPSSPPFLPDLDSELPMTRKKRPWRDLLCDDAVPSSDPPLFSSDDADAGIENYVTPRRKRQHRGAWWDTTPNSRPVHDAQSKVEFSRNVDSGVWMRSDTSESSVVDDASQERVVYDEAAVKSLHTSAMAGDGSAGDAYAQWAIQRALEGGHETVDLSDLSLQTIADATLRPLHSLIKLPRVCHEAPSSDDYESFTPALQLYLSRNALRSLPCELWTLQNLTVLSLRNNKITELPPAISNLDNLVELNVSGNRLRWLPYELLRLLGRDRKLQRFTVLPNPLFQGIRGDMTVSQTLFKCLWCRPEYFGAHWEEMFQLFRERTSEVSESPDVAVDLSWALRLLNTFKACVSTGDITYIDNVPDSLPWRIGPVYMASTPVTFFYFDGAPVPGSAAPPSSLHLSTKHLDTLPPSQSSSLPATDTASTTRVPSLFELALRACALSPSLPHLASLLPDDAPGPVLRGLCQAEDAKSEGGRLCSVCGKEYVLPRAEWVEFWRTDPDALVCSVEEMYLPFLRRACSWGCVEERAAEEIAATEA